MATTSKLDKVIALCKERGFVFPCGEIYGGTRSAWDYGPFGAELKDNIKRQWWRTMVQRRDDVVGLDSSVILPTAVWEASGHVQAFTDPLVESLHTHKRYRADHLIEEYEAEHGHAPENGLADIPDPETGEFNDEPVVGDDESTQVGWYSISQMPPMQPRFRLVVADAVAQMKHPAGFRPRMGYVKRLQKPE